MKFLRNHLNIRYISSFSEIKASDYGAFIVGSDQVWRPKYNPALKHSFLDFTWNDGGRKNRRRLISEEKRDGGWNVRRIAYSVSFGCDGWEYTERQTALATELAGRFDALSFRELSGVKNAAEHLGVNAVTALDPTMLLDAEDFLGLIEPRKDCSHPSGMTGRKHQELTGEERLKAERHSGVFEYVLDRTAETEGLVAGLEKQLAMPIRRFLTANPRGREEISLRVQPSVESWIAGISGADFVLTDSFHACVFSILFHRPFAVVGNRSRGLSRISWLLGQFGLESRLLGAGESIPKHDIDWEGVDERLEHLRAESLEFLRRNLS